MNRTRLSWQDELTLELRMHDWDGSQIGDALAEVSDHCQQSGESPVEAFGNATAYARSLVEQRPGYASVAGIGSMEVLGTLGGLIGLILAPQAAAGLFEGTDVSFSLGGLIGLAVAVLAGAVLLIRPTPILRFVTRGGVLPVVLVGLVPLTVMSVLFFALDGQVLALPWPVVAAAAGLALTLSVVGLWHLRGGDPVRDPATGRTAHPGPLLRVMTVLLFPILAAMMVGPTYLLTLI